MDPTGMDLARRMTKGQCSVVEGEIQVGTADVIRRRARQVLQMPAEVIPQVAYRPSDERKRGI